MSTPTSTPKRLRAAKPWDPWGEFTVTAGQLAVHQRTACVCGHRGGDHTITPGRESARIPLGPCAGCDCPAFWPPGIVGTIAYHQKLHDESACACGHSGGVHGHTGDPAPRPRIGRGACYHCACQTFTAPAITVPPTNIVHVRRDGACHEFSRPNLSRYDTYGRELDAELDVHAVTDCPHLDPDPDAPKQTVQGWTL